ncbi:Glycosyl phosphatidyl inositol protein transamidase complex subunit [Rhodotorula sphaerocarpa]
MISRIRRILDRRRSPGAADETQQLRIAMQRRDAILARILSFAPYLRTLLVVAGLLYTLALPHQLLGRKHYIDENALQPGQVNTYWNWADVHVADRFADNVVKWAEMPRERSVPHVPEPAPRLGLTEQSASQTGQSLSGTNTYAVLAAPKTDGAEAIVLSASWLSRARSEDGERRVNVRGVALLLAMANYFKKYSMWSKDIIFVVSDGYMDGMQAWLDAYHGNGQSNLMSSALPLTTGPIWAAVDLDYPHHSFSHIGLYFEGANGRLPNLDLVNSASRILHHIGVPPLLHTYNPSDDSSLVNQVAAGLPSTAQGEAREYLHHAANLFRQVALSADGRVAGPEGSFGRYRIDAITLFGVPAEGPHGFHVLGRTIESLTRSLNNLLERLHASGFLYLMTSVDTFISATNYLAAPLLIGAGLTIDGLLTWSKAGGAAGRERPVLTVVGLLAVVLLVGAAELAVVTRLDPERPLPEYLSAGLVGVHLFVPLVVVNLLASPLSPAAPLSPSTLSPLLRAAALLTAGLLISVTAILNFGLSLLLAVHLALVQFLLPPLFSRRYRLRQSTRRRVQQFALALASPGGVWTVARIACTDRAEGWLRGALRDWHVAGGWSLPLAVGVVGPLVLLQAVAVQL